MHCQFCPSDSLHRKKQDIKDEYMMKILDELRDKNAHICFHVLGEPLLNKNFFHYLSLCDEYNIEVHLISNMIQLTTDVLENIVQHKSVVLLDLSFQTTTEEDFRIRGGGGLSFEEYFIRLESIVFNEKRIASNMLTRINVMNDLHCYHDKLWGVFTREKWENFIDTADSWKEKLKKFTSGQVSASYRQENYYTIRSELPKELRGDITYELSSNLVVLLKHFGTAGMSDAFRKYLNARPYYQYEIKNIPRWIPVPCLGPMAATVLSNGEIACCCVDSEGSISLGNIENISLLEAVSSKKRKKVILHPELFKTCRLCRGKLVFQTKK
ncbi:radical SAM protein [Spirochaetia bacterium]|nr:radical SAM protein [Spirochaetia bacterium]